MHINTALTWSWLNVLTKKRYDALISVFGNLDDALSAIDESLLKSLGCREETIFKTLNRLEEFDVDWYTQQLHKRGITLISIEDDEYPNALRSLPDPPIFLSYIGSLNILKQPCIALVGTRDISLYGKMVTEEFTNAFVKSGIVTVSGLARGIDTEVAKETIKAGGKTVAVLGHGLPLITPVESKRLSEEIVKNGGLLLSEYPLDASADKYTFPARNRIIAGLCLVTVVLEAGKGSGALITADLAVDYGRDAYAVPGQIFEDTYLGCHTSIARNMTKIACNPNAVLQDIGIISNTKQNFVHYEPKDETEKTLLQTLTTMPQSTGDIVEKSALSPSSINATLTMLELQGVAKNVGNGQWVKK
ncbi:MAG: DNA-processing protein DprA [Candidatus Peribacteraceae bacterium]|nr:DNA-processing protein DprA [Candidatus Peribacteraceae bacterium]